MLIYRYTSLELKSLSSLFFFNTGFQIGGAAYTWTSTVCLFFVLLVIKEEAVDSRAEVKSFNKSDLKHVKTEEKHFMPSAQGKVLCSSRHCNYVHQFVKRPSSEAV